MKKIEYLLPSVVFLNLMVGLLLIFELQIVGANYTIGYCSINTDLVYFFTFCISLLLILFFVPRIVVKPSDFFIFLYFLVVLYPYLIFYNIRDEYSYVEYFVQLIILLLPVFFVLVFSFFFRKISFRQPMTLQLEYLVLICILLALASIILSLLNPTPSAGFGMEDSYIRRLEGREVYTLRSPLAYLNSMAMNGIVPLLAFYSAWKLRLFLLFFCLMCWLVFFYLLGVKAPLLFIIISFLIGYSVRINKTKYLLYCISILVLASVCVSLLEFRLFKYSYVADYLIRRALTVPPFLISAYFEFIVSSYSFNWDILTGLVTTDPVGFVVGEQFLGMPGLNANTNAFIYSLADGGLFKYFATIILVATVFGVLDMAYKSGKNPMLIYVGFLYAILITEQAATTALVSSGVAFVLIIATLAESKTEPKMVMKD